jgi:hypothetical protein
MRKLAIAILWSCLATAQSLAAQAPHLEGTWEGVIAVRPGEFEVDMKLVLERAADGSLTGRLSYPDQRPKEYTLDKVEAENGALFFTAADEQGTVSVFQGQSGADGRTVTGELTESGQKANFELHRVEAAPDRKTPALQSLSRDGAELKAFFNQAAGQVRVLMILSPTCGICRMGARMVERHLREVRDPSLGVAVVWEAIGPQDTQETAAQAASLFGDERIHCFWSPDRFASSAFQAPLGVQRTTAWDVFLVFGKGKLWTDAPPAVDAFMHNLKSHAELPKDRLLNAEKLTSEVKGLLAPPAPAKSR